MVSKKERGIQAPPFISAVQWASNHLLAVSALFYEAWPWVSPVFASLHGWRILSRLAWSHW